MLPQMIFCVNVRLRSYVFKQICGKSVRKDLRWVLTFPRPMNMWISTTDTTMNGSDIHFGQSGLIFGFIWPCSVKDFSWFF